MTVIYAIAQQKGGVGKTTTAINLAAALAQAGERTLLVDLDPQFAASRQLGIDVSELPLTLVDALQGSTDAANAVVADVHGFDVLPGHRDLAKVELTLAAQIARDVYLRRLLDPLRDGYGAVVIDTPPNLGLLTVNALVPADVVLAPVDAEQEGSAQGLAELRHTLRQLAELRDGDEPQLRVVVTRWDARRMMAQTVLDAVRAQGLDPDAQIPARAAVQQAAAFRRPIVLSHPDGAPGRAYRDLAEQLRAAA